MDKFPLVQAKLINKSFGHNKILSRLNLEIYPGEIIGITGVSGAGKTTLLNVLSGLVNPDSGEILYNSTILSKKNLQPLTLKKNKHKLKPYIGYSTQHPSFYEELKVYENLDFFGAMYDVPKAVRHKNIEILIQLTGLGASRNKVANSLSGGMRKRLDIACALIHNPKILFLDEPTSDLDPILRRKVWQIVKELNKQGTTILVSSHFLLEIEKLCTRIAILHKGSIIKTIDKPRAGEKQTSLLEIVVENNEALIGELLKQNAINPEDVISEAGSLSIRTLNPTKLKAEVSKLCNKLCLKLEKCTETSEGLREIFERVVR